MAWKMNLFAMMKRHFVETNEHGYKLLWICSFLNINLNKKFDKNEWQTKKEKNQTKYSRNVVHERVNNLSRQLNSYGVLAWQRHPQ